MGFCFVKEKIHTFRFYDPEKVLVGLCHGLQPGILMGSVEGAVVWREGSKAINK